MAKSLETVKPEQSVKPDIKCGAPTNYYLGDEAHTLWPDGTHLVSMPIYRAGPRGRGTVVECREEIR